jgi:hypothetical protein
MKSAALGCPPALRNVPTTASFRTAPFARLFASANCDDEEHAGRLYVTRMDAKVENPRLRDVTFRHPNLKEWTAEHRPALVAALLTLVQAWIGADRPAYTGKRLAGFEAWSNVIGGVLQHAGVPGFLANRDQVMRIAQRSHDEDIDFVAEWYAHTRSDPKSLEGEVRTKELLDGLGAAVPTPKGSNQPTTISLGRYLERNVNKVRKLDDGTEVAIRRAAQDEHKLSSGGSWTCCAPGLAISRRSVPVTAKDVRT